MSWIIEKQAAAKTNDHFFSKFPATVHVGGDLLTSTITVNVVDEDQDVLPLYDEDGAAVTIAQTSQPLIVKAPITLQFVKGATTNAVGVQVVEL